VSGLGSIFVANSAVVALDRELTQEELAKKLNRAPSYASKYDSGERRLDVRLRLAKVLRVTPEAIFKVLA
jgi:transcriptional regulator with XRE-family HTH domain